MEVLSRTSEWERTLANPDGTWILQQNAEAVRVRRLGGGWVPVDTTLRAVGGQVRPAAVVGEVTLSAGGSGPLAAIAKDGRELSLALPWSLPAPMLDGPRATYRDVLPGVDLVLTAQPEGFSEVLVVRSRQAAANPTLGTLRFAVAATGLSVRAENGGFVAVDAAGATVFTSPAPLMWDSAGGAVREPDWPVEGDRVARMGTTVSGWQVAVVPDRRCWRTRPRASTVGSRRCLIITEAQCRQRGRPRLETVAAKYSAGSTSLVLRRRIAAPVN